MIGKDPIKIRVRSSQSGYLYILQRTSDGRLSLLIPPSQKIHITAGREIVIGSSGDLLVGGPPGEDQILVVVTRSPRSFAAAALEKVGSDEWQYQAAEIKDAVRQGRLTEALLGGPFCPSSQAICDASFGASLFNLTEIQLARR